MTENPNPIAADLDTVRHWLTSLYADLPGWISICSPTDYWKGRRFTTDETGIAAAVERVAELDRLGAKGIYAQVTTLSEQPLGRGGEDLAYGMRGLWSDLDFGTTGHKPAADGLPLPPDEKAVLQVVKESGLPEPTGIIWSGYGAYAWWWLDTPHLIGDDRDIIKQLSTDWQTILAATALEHGWSHDAGVANLDRLLRIPGTVNRKAGGERLSHIGTEGSGALYPLDALQAAASEKALSARQALEAAAAARKPVGFEQPAPSRTPGEQRTGTGPFDVLQTMASWSNVLAGTGWLYVGKHSDGREKWKRDAQAESEYSALCSYDPPVMVVFSSAAGLETGALPAGRKHTMGRVFAHFHYNNDTIEAGRDLMRAAAGKTASSAASALPRNILDTIKQRCQADPFRPALHLVASNQRAVHQTDGTAALKPDHAPVWQPPTETVPPLPSPMPRRNWDDIGNAERVVDRCGTEVRWITDTEQWAIYEGGRWTLKGANTGVWTRVVATIDNLADEAPNYSDEVPVPDEEAPKKRSAREELSEKEEFFKWGRAQRMRPKLAAAREVLQAHPAVHCTMDRFDRPELLLNVTNGVVDLRTGDLLPHDRGLYLMQQASVRYQPDATCPTWDNFLQGVMPDDERREYLARVVGYTLTGSTEEQVMFIHHGDGQNGKGVFMRVLMGLLGDYAQSVPRSTLLAKQADGIPNDVARMMGKRLLSTTETSAGKKLDDELVKQLTGEDVMSARFMRAEFFDFRPVGKIHLATNYLPHVGGGHGIARRLQDIGWDVTVPPSRRIPKLDEKIMANEAAGVLNWAIRGCLDWLAQGLSVPESVKAKTQEHLASSDPVAIWLDEHCIQSDGSSAGAQDLYQSYRTWAEANSTRPMTGMAFAMALKERGFESTKDSRTRRSVYHGLRLAPLGF